ncbi:hypothetical protein VE00_10680 [Pseudogymnoascus sp. WSF 3629]|nr:hypothetical protein VE00_10680 [Pseudogymnoascus sp. WSF 3629]
MSAQNERVQANCKIIWGKADYDLDLETDDWVTYTYVVRKDFGSHFGPPLTMTGICNSETHAWEELEISCTLSLSINDVDSSGNSGAVSPD